MSSISVPTVRPSLNPAQNAWRQAINQKNIRSRTRKKYTHAQKLIWKWTLEQPELAPYINTDGSLTKQGCTIFVQDAAYFTAFISSLVDFENPDDETPFNSEVPIDSKGLSTLESYRSALHKYFEEMKVHQTETYKMEMKMLFGGLGRNHADNQQANGKQTGKDHMQHSFMEACASEGMKLPTNAIFFVCYLLLVWNLMSRTNNIAMLVLSHLSWVDDALCVDCFITKSDQTAKKATSKHIYANPRNPVICPITNLGMYLMTAPQPASDATSHFLFPGAKQAGRFLCILKSVILLAAALVSIVVNVARIGAHSLRKGSVTYATSGSTAAPSIVAILLRAGWSLQGVESRYFRFEAAMDQFLGRVITGLNLNSGSFAILPPFFALVTNNDKVFMKKGG